MARRIELTVKTSYVANWDAEEGIREMVQNGKDAETELRAPLKVDWYPGKGGTLRITNEGATLPLEALLMGHTTKLGRDELIGQFGEGLKLGILALIRAGHTVVVRSGGEVWRPVLEASKVFDADVLAFYIDSGRKDIRRVRIEVQGVDEECWKLLKPRFRFLTTEEADSFVETSSGALLLSPEMKGRIFVKGILAEHDPSFSYGYDLYKADLDRDRKMVSRWDLKWETAQIWNLALAARPDLLEPFYHLLSNIETPKDVEGIKDYPNHLSQSLSGKLTELFTAQFGEDAVPVATLSESREVEHLAAKGIVTSYSLRKVLEKTVGDFAQVKQRLGDEKCAHYSWHDLSQEEKDNLDTAMCLVGVVVDGFTLDRVDVVGFRSKSIMGQYEQETKRVSLARYVLSDKRECLATLVHEVAHHVAAASDGTVQHVRAIETIWADIVVQLWDHS